MSAFGIKNVHSALYNAHKTSRGRNWAFAYTRAIFWRFYIIKNWNFFYILHPENFWYLLVHLNFPSAHPVIYEYDVSHYIGTFSLHFENLTTSYIYFWPHKSFKHRRKVLYWKTIWTIYLINHVHSPEIARPFLN